MSLDQVTAGAGGKGIISGAFWEPYTIAQSQPFSKRRVEPLHSTETPAQFQTPCAREHNFPVYPQRQNMRGGAATASKPHVVQNPDTIHARELIGVFALCVQIVLLDEAVLIDVCHFGKRSRPIHRALPCRIALGSLFGNRVASIDPVGVNVYRGGEVVDVGLECLAADLALQVPDARLLLN